MGSFPVEIFSTALPPIRLYAFVGFFRRLRNTLYSNAQYFVEKIFSWLLGGTVVEDTACSSSKQTRSSEALWLVIRDEDADADADDEDGAYVL